MQDYVRIQSETLLSDNWYVLKTTTFDLKRRDGRWQTMSRETYDRGNGAVALLYNVARRTVLLTRQFRFPAYVNQHDGYLIEAPAGLLDEANPEQRMHAELVRIMNSPHVVERLATVGMDKSTSPTPDDFAKLIAAELQRWPAVVKRAGVTPQ